VRLARQPLPPNILSLQAEQRFENGIAMTPAAATARAGADQAAAFVVLFDIVVAGTDDQSLDGHAGIVAPFFPNKTLRCSQPRGAATTAA